MSNDIKAIETEYDGHRFRSRLEACWAVFFNAVGLTFMNMKSKDSKWMEPDIFRTFIFQA